MANPILPPVPVKAPRLLKPRDVCQILSIGTTTLKKLTRSGDLPVVRMPGNHTRYSEMEVAKFVARFSATQGKGA